MPMPMVCTEIEMHDVASMPDGASAIALLKTKKWPNGSQLHYAFKREQGSAGQRKKVEQTLEEIMQFVNLDFKLKPASVTVAELRIAFDPNGGAWSYIGTDAARQPSSKENMNLGFGYNDGQEGTYRHEVGHFLGAIHEHQNPEGGIQWNKEAVRRDLSGPPNNWDEATIESNMFEKYSRTQINGTQFDPKSIMLYAIPKHWTTNGFSSKPNHNFSEDDIAWLRNQYPGRGGPIGPGPNPNAIKIPVTRLVAYREEIAVPGERDLFSFVAERAKMYHIEALGGTPMALRLFGPNNDTLLVPNGETNNIRTTFNAQLLLPLNPGTYHVQASHVETQGTGKYGIRVLELEDDGMLAHLQGEMIIKAICPLVPGTYVINRQ